MDERQMRMTAEKLEGTVFRTSLGAMGKRTRLPVEPVAEMRHHGQASTLAHGTHGTHGINGTHSNSAKHSPRSLTGCGAALAVVCLGTSGCNGRVAAGPSSQGIPATVAAASIAPADPAPLTGPATAPSSIAYDGSKNGFRLSYPSDWKPKASQDFDFLLLPARTADNKDSKAKDTDLAGPKISIDVPDLPPHFPGMITLGPMEWHYVSEQKQRFADVKVAEKTDLTIPKTDARRLVLTGHAKNADGSAGAAYTVVSLLEIHADRVYVVSAEAKTEDYPAVRAVFDQVVASMVWTK